jgi:hypothetical protein
MVNCNNDAYYFGPFWTFEGDVSETGLVVLIGIEKENVRTHLQSLETTVLETTTLEHSASGGD